MKSASKMPSLAGLPSPPGDVPASGQAYPVALWIAETYPEIFDAHLMLARLSLAMGDPDASRRHALRGLEALDNQEDDVDPEAREWVLEEFRDVLPVPGAFR